VRDAVDNFKMLNGNEIFYIGLHVHQNKVDCVKGLKRK